jgi:hypothetical protein
MDLLHPVLRSPVPASKENPVSEVMNLGGRVFLFHRKLRPMKQKTLREDAPRHILYSGQKHLTD